MLEAQLKEIIKDEPDTIHAYVAQIALNYDPTESFFKDIHDYGCQAGAIKSLIYYRDTHAFFDKYYNDIEEIRLNYECIEGPLAIRGDLKTYLAWLGFEETASQLACELGLTL